MGNLVTWLLGVVMSVVSFLLSPKPQKPMAPTEELQNVPTVHDGDCIYVLFGTAKITSPAVAWYGDVKTTPIKQSAGK